MNPESQILLYTQTANKNKTMKKKKHVPWLQLTRNWECRWKKPMTSLMHMRTLIKVYREKKTTSEFMYRKLEFTFHIYKCIGRRMQQQEQHQYTTFHYNEQWTQHTIFEKWRKKMNK